MPNTFTHIILTRFNLKTMTREGLTENWLTHRLALFRSFCFPSVVGQSVQDFKWLVFFDKDTPSRFHPTIREFSTYENFCPYFLSGFDVVTIRKHVLSHIMPQSDYVITTTLDNDDAIGRRFVEAVQAQFDGQQFEFLNFLNGLRLNLRTNRLYATSLPSNPFVSLVERLESSAITVMGCYPHYDIPRNWKDPVNIPNKVPLWLQTFHQVNVNTSHTLGLRRVSIASLKTDFCVDFQAQPESKMMVSLSNVASMHKVVRSIIDHMPDGLRRRVKDWLQRRRHERWRSK